MVRDDKEDWADMNLNAKLIASTVTVCAALVILSLQGCFSAKSELPAGSIVDESPQGTAPAEKAVRRQPTILRAEVAAPPISGRGADAFSDSAVHKAQFGEETSPIAASHHIADLLPIPSLDAPPPNQR
jgi:hypothetical protein